MREFKKWAKENIFLVDGIGALVSAIVIGMILPRFETEIPKNILPGLSGTAAFFAIFSIGCSYFKAPTQKLLSLIAMANICYALVTLGIVFYHFNLLSVFSIAYFFLEVFAILALSRFELSYSTKARLI